MDIRQLQYLVALARERHFTRAAEACHVIYGGSVKPDNIAQLIAEPDVDGALVGGASLEIGSFADIVTRSRHAAV